MPKKKYTKVVFCCYVENDNEAEGLRELYEQAEKLLTEKVNENNTGKPIKVYTADVIEASLGVLIDDLKKEKE